MSAVDNELVTWNELTNRMSIGAGRYPEAVLHVAGPTTETYIAMFETRSATAHQAVSIGLQNSDGNVALVTLSGTEVVELQNPNGDKFQMDNAGAITLPSTLSLASGGITVSATGGSSITVTNTALTVGDSYSGVRVAVTAAAANNAYGVAAYFDSTLTGTQAGNVYNVGSWINLGATFVDNAGLLVPFEGGIYDAGGTLTTARMVMCQLQAVLSSDPGSLDIFRINYNRGAGDVDAVNSIFAAANTGSIGWVAGAGTSGTQLGYIPLAEIAGVNSSSPVYVRVYDSAT